MTKAANKATNTAATIVAVAAAAPKGAAEVISTPAATTKADKARVIFNESYGMTPVPQRKDILNRAVSEAGLTKAGAATYLQIYKDKNGLSNKKAAAPTA